MKEKTFPKFTVSQTLFCGTLIFEARLVGFIGMKEKEVFHYVFSEKRYPKL